MRTRLASRSQSPGCEIVLRGHAESIGDAIEKCEQSRNINCLGDLIFAPVGFPQLLNIISG